MNYSDILDQVAQRDRNVFRVSYPVNGEPGALCNVQVVCRIVSKDVNGTTLEILDLKQDGPTENTPVFSDRVIPSPS